MLPSRYGWLAREPGPKKPYSMRVSMRLIDDKAHRLWSIWVAGFWGAVGAVIVILSALLYQHFDWRIGALLIAVSATFAIARVLKQPGTE